MYVYHNDPYYLIDDPEDFHNYRYWLLRKHKVANIQTSITQINNSQLGGRSNLHVFSDITMFTYIIPVKCNIKIYISSKIL